MTEPAPEANLPWTERPSAVWLLGLAGALLTYIAHPPVGWYAAAWVGPVPWIVLTRLPTLPGRWPYLKLWIAGVVYWGLTVQWLRLPHPANTGAWLLMAAYLGLYVPLWIGVTRKLRHDGRLPVWVVAPAVWTVLEWARAHLLTGFLMASLAHTQVKLPAVLQVASWAGEYGVTFLIVLVAASIAGAIPLPNEARRRWQATAVALAPGVVAVAGVVGFGWTVLSNAAPSAADEKRSVRIALVQSDLLSDWKGTPERDEAVMRQQIELSRRAIDEADGQAPDLIVWPETMFRLPLFTIDPRFGSDLPRPDGPRLEAGRRKLAELAREYEVAFLVGVDRVNILPERRPDLPEAHMIQQYNSSVFATPDGRVQGTYDKMHLLPFGEYIPLVDWIPWMGDYTPITGSASPGEKPTAFRGEAVYAPNICYETVLPHLIRRQMVELTAKGDRPDVLINLTNDAWYWGSSELDMHLASGVLRAVEHRTPLVIAANRGLSAYVDRYGRVVAVSERDRPEVLVVDVELPPPAAGPPRLPTLYSRWGDWLPATCLILLATYFVIHACRSATTRRP